MVSRMPPWSPSETTALLRAWHEDADTPAPLRLYHQQTRSASTTTSTATTLYERFVGLCGGKTQRSEASVLGRRDAFRAMWSLISAFNREQQQHTDPKEQQRLWFALPEWEKRLVFARKSQGKPHVMLEVGRVTFAELDKIMAITRRQAEREKQRVEAERHEKSAEFLRASAVAAVHRADEAVEKIAAHKADDIIISHQDTLADEDSGSSTESDDDIVFLEQMTATQHRPVSDTTSHNRNTATPTPLEHRENQPRSSSSSTTAAISGREDDGWHPIITQKSKRIKLSGCGTATTKSENQSPHKPKTSEVTSNSSEPASKPVTETMMASSMSDSESRLRRRLLPHPPPEDDGTSALSSAAAQAANYCELRLQKLYSSSQLPPLSPNGNAPAVRQPAVSSSGPAPRSETVNTSKSRLQRLYSSSASAPPPPINTTFPSVRDPAPRSSTLANASESRLHKLFASSASPPPPPPINPAQLAGREPAASSTTMPIWRAEKSGAQHPGQHLYFSGIVTSAGDNRNRVNISKSHLERYFRSPQPQSTTSPSASRASPPPTANYSKSRLQRFFLSSPSTPQSSINRLSPPSTRSPRTPISSPASTANYSKSRSQRLFSSPPSIDHPSQPSPRVGSPPTRRPSSTPTANYSDSRLQNLFSSSVPTSSLSRDNASAVGEPGRSPLTTRSSPAPAANTSESRSQKEFPSSLSSSIDNVPTVCQPAEEEEESPAVRESVADAPAMPLWLALKPKSDHATTNPAVQKLISTLLDKHANIPRRRQPTSTSTRSDLRTSEVADLLNAQINELSRVFYDFQALQQADAEHRNQFLADVQRDEADKKCFEEEVEQLEARIKRERDEWTQERAVVKREWERLRAK